MSYKIILVPEKAVLPEDVVYPVVKTGDLISRIYEAKDQEIILPVNTRELQLLIEYRDLIDVSLRAVIGLTGAMYNTIWNTYIATLTRITVDNLKAETKEYQDSRSDAGQFTGSTEATRRSSVTELSTYRKPAGETEDDNTGTIE